MQFEDFEHSFGHINFGDYGRPASNPEIQRLNGILQDLLDIKGKTYLKSSYGVPLSEGRIVFEAIHDDSADTQGIKVLLDCLLSPEDHMSDLDEPEIVTVMSAALNENGDLVNLQTYESYFYQQDPTHGNQTAVQLITSIAEAIDSGKLPPTGQWLLEALLAKIKLGGPESMKNIEYDFFSRTSLDSLSQFVRDNSETIFSINSCQKLLADGRLLSISSMFSHDNDNPEDYDRITAELKDPVNALITTFSQKAYSQDTLTETMDISGAEETEDTGYRATNKAETQDYADQDAVLSLISASITASTEIFTDSIENGWGQAFTRNCLEIHYDELKCMLEDYYDEDAEADGEGIQEARKLEIMRLLGLFQKDFEAMHSLVPDLIGNDEMSKSFSATLVNAGINKVLVKTEKAWVFRAGYDEKLACTGEYADYAISYLKCDVIRLSDEPQLLDVFILGVTTPPADPSNDFHPDKAVERNLVRIPYSYIRDVIKPIWLN